jgi:hypothetical protein
MNEAGTSSARVVTTRTLRIWLRDDGIVQVVGLPGAELNRADAEDSVVSCWEVAEHRCLPVLCDVRPVKSVDRGARSYYANVRADRACPAAALLVGSALTRMIGGFVMGLVPKPVPIRMFTSEPEAVAWLRGFVQ